MTKRMTKMMNTIIFLMLLMMTRAIMMVTIRELFDYYQAGGLETAEELEVGNQTSNSNHQNNQTSKSNHQNQTIKITIKSSK